MQGCSKNINGKVLDLQPPNGLWRVSNDKALNHLTKNGDNKNEQIDGSIDCILGMPHKA